MLKKIVRHGCGRAVTLPKTILEAVGFNPNGVVEMTIERGRIILSVPRVREWGQSISDEDDDALDKIEDAP